MRILILLISIFSTSHIVAVAQDKERKAVITRIEDVWAKGKSSSHLPDDLVSQTPTTVGNNLTVR